MNRLACSRETSMSWLFFVSTSALHREAVRRSRIEVLEQEMLDGERLAAQHFLDQVVQDEALAAGEVSQPEPHVFVSGEGERDQLQPGDPTFRPQCRAPHGQTDNSRCTVLRKNWVASSGVNSRSTWRISTICPRPRSRARGRGGSSRLAMTRCSCDGRCSRRKVIC